MINRKVHIELFLFLISVFIYTDCSSQRASFFENLSIDQGLKENHIFSLKKDAKGFLWFGTFGGLHRYDGNRFEYFLHDSDDSTTISHNNISCFYEDHDFLWIGTDLGIDRFNQNSGEFKRFSIGLKNANYNGELQVRSIVSTSDSTLWIGTYGNGLLHVTKEGYVLNHYLKENSSLSSDFINTLHVRKNTLLIGTEGSGLLTFDFEEEFFQRIISLYPKLFITQIKEQDGKLWVATWGKGVVVYDLTKKELLQEINTDNSNLADNTVRDFLFYNDEVWFGTAQGISILNLVDRTIKNEVFEFGQPNGLPHNYICRLEKDEEGIWIGTFGGGISKYEFRKQYFTMLNKESSFSHLRGGNVVCDFLDSREIVWVVTRDYGLEALDASNGFTPLYFDILRDFKKLKIRSIFETKVGELVLAGEKGIFLISKDLKIVTQINDTEHSFPGAVIFDIQEDDERNLWLGGWNTGLIKIDMNSDNPTFEKYGVLEGMPSETIWNIALKDSVTLLISFNHKFVEFDVRKKRIKSTIFSSKVTSSIIEKDTLWFSTEFNGVFKKGLNSDSIITIPIKYKGEDISVSGFILTEQNLWVVTKYGLFKYDKSGNKSQVFTSLDGLPTQFFVFNTAINAKNENLLIGTEHGLILWNESDCKKEIEFPTVYYSRLTYLDSVIFDGYLGSLDETFQFAYDQNNLSLQMSTIGHLNPSIFHIEYKIGKEEEWTDLNDLQERISLVELSSGEYVISARVASNLNGSYGETSRLTLKILPPFWNTWWFRLLILVILMLCLILFYFWRMSRVKKINKWLEDEVNERTENLSERNEELLFKNEEIQLKITTILDQQKKLKMNDLNTTDSDISHLNILDPELKGNKVLWFSAYKPPVYSVLIHFFELRDVNDSDSLNELLDSYLPDLIISDDLSIRKENVKKPILILKEGLETIEVLKQINELLVHKKDKIHAFLVGEDVNLANTNFPADTKFMTELIEFIDANMTRQDINGRLIAKEFALSKSAFYRQLKMLTGLSTTELIKIVRLRKAYGLLKSERLSVSQVSLEVGFNSVSYFSTNFTVFFGFKPSQI